MGIGKILLLCVVLLLTGCASWFTPLGDDKYECNRKENAKSAHCISFKGIEESSRGKLPVSRYDKVVSMSERDKLLGIAPDEESSTKADRKSGKTTIDGGVLPHQRAKQSLNGQPVRQAPVIQKVWIKRFVDDNDTLVNSTTVYREIRPTRWTGFDAMNTSTTKTSGTSYPHKPASSAQPEASSKPIASAAPAQIRQPTSNDSNLAQPSASPEFDGSLPQ